MRGNRPKGIVITPRDREFLGALAESRLADREMFQAITGVRLVSRANGLLARLHAARLLKRYYLGTPAGGQKALYELTSKGAAIRTSTREAKYAWLSNAIAQLDKHDQATLFAAGQILKRLVNL